MNQQDYRQVIQQMCLYTGIKDWQEIAELQHVIVDHITVGLMYRDNHQNAWDMFLYFDFGQINALDLPQKLLELNADPQTEEEGCFGIHHQTSSIVYRAKIQLLSENKGIELADKIQHFLKLGQHRLHNTLSMMLFT